MTVDDGYPDDVAGLFQRLGKPGKTAAYHDFSGSVKAPPPRPVTRPVAAVPAEAPAVAMEAARPVPVAVEANAPVVRQSVPVTQPAPVAPLPVTPAPTPLQLLFQRLLSAPPPHDEPSPLERLKNG